MMKDITFKELEIFLINKFKDAILIISSNFDTSFLITYSKEFYLGLFHELKYNITLIDSKADLFMIDKLYYYYEKFDGIEKNKDFFLLNNYDVLKIYLLDYIYSFFTVPKPYAQLYCSSKSLIILRHLRSETVFFVTLNDLNVMLSIILNFYYGTFVFNFMNRNLMIKQLRLFFSTFYKYYLNCNIIKNDIKEADLYFYHELLVNLWIPSKDFSEQNKVLYSMYQNQDLLLSHESKQSILEKVIKLENECENLIKKKLNFEDLRSEFYALLLKKTENGNTIFYL